MTSESFDICYGLSRLKYAHITRKDGKVHVSHETYAEEDDTDVDDEEGWEEKDYSHVWHIFDSTGHNKESYEALCRAFKDFPGPQLYRCSPSLYQVTTKSLFRIYLRPWKWEEVESLLPFLTQPIGKGDLVDLDDMVQERYDAIRKRYSDFLNANAYRVIAD